MKSIVLIFVACATLAACSTVAGVGEDLSSGARAVQNAF